jgi:hypothetical protein
VAKNTSLAYCPLRCRYRLAASGSTRFIRFSRSLVSGRCTSGFPGPPPSPSLRTGSTGVVGNCLRSSPVNIILILPLISPPHLTSPTRGEEQMSVRVTTPLMGAGQLTPVGPNQPPITNHELSTTNYQLLSPLNYFNHFVERIGRRKLFV